MNVPPFVSRAIRSWMEWRTKARLYRASPVLRLLDAKERQARAAHKAGRPIQRQRQAAMTDLLRKGVHHG